MDRRSATITYKGPLQVLLIAFALGALVVPIVLVFTSGTARFSASWTALRVTGLLAYTFVFFNIMTGSMGLPFYRLFNPRLVSRFHKISGLTGFSPAVAHGILVLTRPVLGVYAVSG